MDRASRDPSEFGARKIVRMRILLVNYEYPPLGGGGGVLTRTLVSELALDHDVTVLTSGGRGAPGESFDDGARVLRVPVVGRRETSRASLASMVSFVPAARRIARRTMRVGSFDVVHTFFAVPSGPAGSWIARRVRAPHVLTVIGADIHDPSRLSPDRFRPLGRVVSRIVGRADAVTAISGDIARRAEHLTSRRDIALVPCGVAPPALPARDRRSLGWTNDEIVVLTIARLVARKGLEALVRAVGVVGSPLRLEIVGEGPERERLESLAASIAPGRVTFAGGVSEGEKGRRLSAADAFALVSQHEGFGLVYLEAMHAGLPVVAGTVGGQTDFLRHGINAVLADPGDVEGVAASLQRLVTDRPLRDALVEAGRRTAAEHLPGRMAARYLETYERAIASHRSLT
jgi:glycosyltransferase involved in cell wall biosynthesis